jgi:hypothetical protein
MSEATIAMLVEIFGPLVASVVSAILIWLLSEIARQVRARTNNELAVSAIDRLTHTVATTVMEMEQTIVPTMKKAASDGKLSREDVNILRDMALARVKNRLQPSVQKQAARVVADIDGLLQGKIEQLVYSMKGACDGPNADR